MSYWIEDSEGFRGDVATNSGMAELRAAAGPKLRYLLDSGSMTSELGLKAIVLECEQRGMKEIARILKGASVPVTVTDGVIDEEENS